MWHRDSIGRMARSATALRVSEFILVGRRDFNSFGSHGSTSATSIPSPRLVTTSRSDCDICGVEIADGGTGLSAECEIFDFFIYIPQCVCGTASLNVTVAAAIVLHHFGGNLTGLAISILEEQRNLLTQKNLHCLLPCDRK